MSDAMTQAPSVDTVAKALDDLIDGWFGDRAQANLNTADLARAAIKAMNIPALLTEERTKALSEKEAELALLKTVIGLIEVDLSAGDLPPKTRVAWALSRTRAALKAEGGEK